MNRHQKPAISKRKMQKKRISVFLCVIMVIASMFSGMSSGSVQAKAAAKAVTKKVSMKQGKTKQLKIAGVKKAKWKSSKSSVVKVNQKGKITAKKKGTAVVTAVVKKTTKAKKKLKGKTYRFKVTVKADKKKNKEEASAKPDATPIPIPTPEPTSDNHITADGKILVAYFSWSGTSEKIAKNIIEQTGADSFRIERQTPYSTDYTETAYGDAKTEADANARPAIKNPLASVSQYEKIVLCYPIWWHTAPMTVGTFLESYDLSGKMIYPVSQSASMDRTQYEQSVTFIRACAPGAVVDDGIFSKDNATISTYITEMALK